MASRLFWIFLVVAALAAGTLFQGRDLIFAWAGDSAAERATDAAIEGRVERAIEGSFERMQVVDSDGRTVDVAPQTKRDLGAAVRRLASAEAELALLRVRGADGSDSIEARSRRDQAKADVERLKAEIERQEELPTGDRDAVRQQIQQEVRSSVRETVRSAVRG